MGSTGYIGYGSSVSYSADGVNFTKIAQVANISGPDLEVGEAKITNNDSPNATVETIPALLDPGTLTFTIVKETTNLNALYGMIRQTKYWKVQDAAGSSWVDQGWIKSMKPGQPLEDTETVELTIRFSGKPTYSN